MLNYALGVIIIVLGLALSIGLHEVGHLVPAKLFGIRVTQYMIGFGPTIWSVRRGETEYGLKLLPLGGYIAMVGMFLPEAHAASRSARRGWFARMIQDARDQAAEDLTPADEYRTFTSKPVWQRIIVMLGGPFMNLVLATVFFAIILMGFGTPQASTTIAAVSQCVIPAGSSQTECASSDPLSPAAAAGFRAGDRVVSVDGAALTRWSDFTRLISEHPNQALSVQVERDGSRQTLTLTPQLTQRYQLDANGRVLERDGKPVLQNIGFAGLSPATEMVRQGPAQVAQTLATTVTQTAVLIANLPQKIAGVVQSTVAGTERDPNGPISVVGIGAVAGEVFSLPGATVDGRIATMLGILASLNIALFLFNLLPLLPLDGGHVAGALWELLRRAVNRLRGRRDPGPVDTARLVPLTTVMVILLVSLSGVLIWADIVNPVSLFR